MDYANFIQWVHVLVLTSNVSFYSWKAVACWCWKVQLSAPYNSEWVCMCVVLYGISSELHRKRENRKSQTFQGHACACIKAKHIDWTIYTYKIAMTMLQIKTIFITYNFQWQTIAWPSLRLCQLLNRLDICTNDSKFTYSVLRNDCFLWTMKTSFWQCVRHQSIKLNRFQWNICDSITHCDAHVNKWPLLRYTLNV